MVIIIVVIRAVAGVVGVVRVVVVKVVIIINSSQVEIKSSEAAWSEEVQKELNQNQKSKSRGPAGKGKPETNKQTVRMCCNTIWFGD